MLTSKQIQKLENVGSERQEEWWTVLITKQESDGKIAFAKVQNGNLFSHGKVRIKKDRSLVAPVNNWHDQNIKINTKKSKSIWEPFHQLSSQGIDAATDHYIQWNR